MFQPAVKEPFTLKLAIAGIAGVGKTYTSFQLATLLASGQPFAVIDTENRKSRKYADTFRFDVADLETTFSLGAYAKEIKAAEAAGYKVLVIDGLSQLWEGKDGIKDLVEMIARRDKIPTFSAWQQGNALLFAFLKLILDSPLHIICTLRSKTEYASSVNDNNKTQYRRVGLAPIQKDNLEFEFDLFTEMNHEHHLIFQKSLCTKLSGKVLPMAEEGAAKKLVAILKSWMQGEPVRPVPKSEPTVSETEAEAGAESRSTSVATEPQPSDPVLSAQIASIQRLCERLGKNVEELPQTSAEAKELIKQLSEEFKQSRTPTNAPAPKAQAEAEAVPTVEDTKTPGRKELADTDAIPKGMMVQITNLATEKRKQVTKPTTYGEAKRLLAALQAAS